MKTKEKSRQIEIGKGKDLLKEESKNKPTTPQIDMITAINHVKDAYKNVGINLKSFEGMADAMAMSTAHARKAFGEMKGYGLIEQEGDGWRVSELGEQAIKGEKEAIIDVLRTNKIMDSVYSELKDKPCDKDYIEDFIRKKRFAYKINTSLVADRFLEAIRYINELKAKSLPEVTEAKQEEFKPIFFKIIQLKYALEPKPTEHEQKELVEEVCKELKDTDDIAIKLLVEHLSKAENGISRKAIADSLFDIMLKKYTHLFPKQEKTTHNTKGTDQEEISKD
jgi:hypothetical protein